MSIEEEKDKLDILNNYLNNLKKKSKDYLVGFIEGLIMSERINN